MSIEQTFERIAVALEEMVALMPKGQLIPPLSAIPVEEVKEKKVAKKSTPPMESPEGMFVSGPVASEVVVSPAFTYEQLVDSLTAHAKMYGNTITIALMKRYGADQISPKMKSIPETNYAACIGEIEIDLKKKAA